MDKARHQEETCRWQGFLSARSISDFDLPRARCRGRVNHEAERSVIRLTDCPAVVTGVLVSVVW